MVDYILCVILGMCLPGLFYSLWFLYRTVKEEIEDR